MTLADLELGDPVVRNLGGVEMVLRVTEMTDDVIECGPWTFDKATGAEIDEELDWGPPPKRTGSVIRPQGD